MELSLGHDDYLRIEFLGPPRFDDKGRLASELLLCFRRIVELSVALLNMITTISWELNKDHL